jgi:hypothetical protein
MKKTNAIRTAGFACALAFGLTACGDDITKYYDSEGQELSVSDTLLVKEVVKDYDTIVVTKVVTKKDTIKVTDVITKRDTVKVTNVITKKDTVKVTDVITKKDTVKTTIVIKDTIRDTIRVEVIPEIPKVDLVYGTVNLSYAQFYYGEVNNVEPELNATTGIYDKVSIPESFDGYDAFTSATTSKYKSFGQLDANVGESTTELKGVKAVNVAISKALYDEIKKKGSKNSKSDLYKLVSAMTVLDAAPAEYKVINSDGVLSKTYGKTVTRTSTPTLTSSSNWGNYMVVIPGVDITEANTNNLQGIVLETEDGASYGLIPLGNIWLDVREFAFSVAEFIGGHGAQPYKATTDIAGKRISTIRYLIKDAPDVALSTSLYVPIQLPITGAVAEDNSSITFTVDASISNYRSVGLKLISYSIGSGRNAVTTNIANGSAFSTRATSIKFPTDGLKAGDYTFTFEDANGIAATYKVKIALKQDGAAVEDLSGLVYGTVDLTYAQFFNGEINDIEANETATTGNYTATSVAAWVEEDYDAFSSATKSKYTFYGQVNAEVGEANSKLKGVKAVNVAISKALYAEVQKKIADKSSEADGNDLIALVKAGTWNTEKSTEYKVINPNGSVSKTQGVTYKRNTSTVPTVSTTSNWGNYLVQVNGVDITEANMKNLQGIVLETEDGTKYGLIHLGNIFNNPGEFAFSVEAMTEPHGNKVPYQSTEGIEGKRIAKILYLLKDANDVELSTNIYVPVRLGVSAGAETITVGEEITFTVDDAIANYPSAKLKLVSYTVGSGRTAVTTAIENGGTFSSRAKTVKFDSSVLTVTEATSYKFNFTDASGILSGRSITVTVKPTSSEE